MIRRLLFEAMRAGRLAAFALVLAVAAGVGSGLASAAIAQATSPKADKLFRLGETNVFNATSQLVGSVAQNAMLLVDNDGGGPALDLRVDPGQAPMRVDSATKVASLNADQLDGRDASDFLPSGAKASDSDRLDGKNSADFYAAGEKVGDAEHADRADAAALSGYAVVSGHGSAIAPGDFGSATAVCPGSTQVLGGGYKILGQNPVEVVGSSPISNVAVPGGPPQRVLAWHVVLKNVSSESVDPMAYAVCADVSN